MLLIEKSIVNNFLLNFRASGLQIDMRNLKITGLIRPLGFKATK